MSERSETESERDLEGIDVVSEPDASSKRSSLRSGVGGLENNLESSPAPHQVLLAAAYLDDARTGTHMEFEPTVSAVNMYTTYKNWWVTILLYIALATILGLAVFESPTAKYISLPFYITVGVEIVCIAFFMFRLAHEFLFSKKTHFWRDEKHLMIICIVCLTLVDICIYTGLYESNITSIRWSRCLRPLLIVNIPEGRQIRRAFRNIRRTLPGVTSVLVLFFLVLLLFTIMFFKLFKDKGLKKIDGQPYFNNFFDTYWDLYVLVTTANNPDIMMPAYNDNALYSIFFVVFEVVCLYIFMSIFLAVVYNNYRNNLKREVKEAVERKNELVDLAFDLMKTDVFGREVVLQDDFKKLLKITLPKKSEQYFKILWCVLDTESTGYINRQEFHNLPDLINIKITEVKQNLFQRYIPKIYNGKYSKLIIRGVKHQYFRYIFDAIILINAIVIITEWDYVEWGFLAIFTIEIFLKIYAFGFHMFISKLWNRFDSVIIGSAFLFDIVDEANGDNEDANIILDVLLILRVLRIVKILHGIDCFKNVLNTILHILPSLATYAGVLFVFIYIYAIIGMESFKDRVQFFGINTYNTTDPTQRWCGNPNLENSNFYRDKYCANNFNDIGSAIMVMFELLVVNQWHVLTEGFVLATGSKFTRLYFVSFHLISVIIILNIFTAFVLEAFLLEYSFSKGSLETALETKINEMGLAYGSRPVAKKKPKNTGSDFGKEPILDDVDEDGPEECMVDADHDNLQFVAAQLEDIVRQYTNYSRDTDIRFHLKKGAMNVHTLLQKMFQHEIEVTNKQEDDKKANSPSPLTDLNTQFDAFN